MTLCLQKLQSKSSTFPLRLQTEKPVTQCKSSFRAKGSSSPFRQTRINWFSPKERVWFHPALECGGSGCAVPSQPRALGQVAALRENDLCHIWGQGHRAHHGARQGGRWWPGFHGQDFSKRSTVCWFRWAGFSPAVFDDSRAFRLICVSDLSTLYYLHNIADEIPQSHMKSGASLLASCDTMTLLASCDTMTFGFFARSSELFAAAWPALGFGRNWHARPGHHLESATRQFPQKPRVLPECPAQQRAHPRDLSGQESHLQMDLNF